MLNSNWKSKYDSNDFGEWQRVEATTPPFFPSTEGIINRLLAKYFRSEKGRTLGPDKNIYQKKIILEETMKELEREVCMDSNECAKIWKERQEAEESLDTKLEREKGMYESKISSRENFITKVSQRDVAALTPIFDVTTAPEAVAAIKSGVRAPVVSAQISTLGGPEHVTIMILVCLEPRESWVNGILENSRYARFSLEKNGTMEYFSGRTGVKFRKTRAKSIEDAVAKLNAFVASAGVSA